ncbi:MAG: HAD family acid phosphatase [PVC group bacterium]
MKVPSQPILLVLFGALLGAGCGGDDPAARDEKLPACIVDIDKTITDGNYQRHTSHKVPLPAATDVLRRIEEGGITVFYLSGRYASKLPRTVAWLEKHGFPTAGRVIHMQPEQGDIPDYKLREIRKIQERYEILCGFGNDSDLPVYRQADIHPICREMWRNEDWAEVSDNLDRLGKCE